MLFQKGKRAIAHLLFVQIVSKSRGVKQGPFYVLWTPSMPSVLVELGFLSNTEEEQFLMTKEGQEYMASAIYRSIKDYKSEIEMN